jgi:diamine N-acetyltransferase
VRASDAPGVVTLREITADTVDAILGLRVRDDQAFVATNAKSIAQAHFHPEIAWYRAIYADDTPVGFVMLSDDPGIPEYYLWRLMIDERFQGRGYGRRAMGLLIAHVRTRPGAAALITSVVPGEGGPAPFYEKLGFAFTGETEDDELVMSLSL